MNGQFITDISLGLFWFQWWAHLYSTFEVHNEWLYALHSLEISSDDIKHYFGVLFPTASSVA